MTSTAQPVLALHSNAYLRGLIVRACLVIVSFALLSSCAATTKTLDPDVEKHYDASYDFSDKKQIVNTLTDSLLSAPQISTENDKPIVIVYGIDNETSEHINTGGITDDIRLKLIKSGEYRFINRKQRENLVTEADYQYAGFVAPEQRVNEGRQLGADFILSGTLRSIEKEQPRQWRLNKSELVYYSMNLELTNLETGEISWADSVEIARESSRPIIGW
ncbi:MAG: penicillin-binding protein activator LpoB [Granulosicoccus sp.]